MSHFAPRPQVWSFFGCQKHISSFIIISLFKSMALLESHFHLLTSAKCAFKLCSLQFPTCNIYFSISSLGVLTFNIKMFLVPNGITKNADLIRLMQCFQFWFLCKMPNCTYYSTWTTANSGFEIAFYSSELSNKVFTNFSLFDGNPKRQDFFIPKFLKFPMRFTSEYI